MANPPEVSDEIRMIAAVPYFLGFLGPLGLISALIMFLVAKERHLRFHAACALIFEAVFIIVMTAAFAAGFVATVALGIVTLGPGFLATFVVWAALAALALAFIAVRLMLAFKTFSDAGFRPPLLSGLAERALGAS